MLDFTQHRLRAIGVNTVRIVRVQRDHDGNENRGCNQPPELLGAISLRLPPTQAASYVVLHIHLVRREESRKAKRHHAGGS